MTKVTKKNLEKKIDEFKNLKEYKKCGPEDIYEIWEYYERQVKFIIQGQRIYDYFGFDWYLPFWDGEAIRFWSEMPLELRKNQYLFKDYLKRVILPDFLEIFILKLKPLIVFLTV